MGIMCRVVVIPFAVWWSLPNYIESVPTIPSWVLTRGIGKECYIHISQDGIIDTVNIWGRERKIPACVFILFLTWQIIVVIG